MEGEQTVILWGTGLCNYSVLVPSVSLSLPLPLPGLKLSASAFFFFNTSQSLSFFSTQPIHRYRVASAKAHRGQLPYWNQENNGFTCSVSDLFLS